MFTAFRRSTAAVILLAVLACGVHATAPTFADQLAEADEVRSVDPEAFARLLDELSARTDEATSTELEHLRYLKAYRLAYAGRFDLAIREADALFASASAVETRFRAGLLAANSYAATREFAAGLGYMDKSLALMAQVEDRQLRHDGMTVAAVLYNQVGQYELGRDLAEQILLDEPGARSRCFAGYLRMEAMQQLQADPVPSLDAVDELIALCDEQKEALATHLARGQRARMLAAGGRLDEAISSLEDHLAAVEATHYPRLVTEIHSLLGELLLQRGDLDASERFARQAIEGSGASVYSQPVVTAYRTLYEAALQRGQTDQALENYRAYAQADKAYLDDVKARELAFQMARHETIRKEQTIELLNNQNRVLQLEQEVAKQDARNTQLLVALLVVLLGFIGYWAWKTKKMQVSFRRLAETDTLTGISNRHHFSREAEAILARCERDGETATLVMFDLDQFKSINDRFGHPVGDWVLMQVAAALRDCGRHGDPFGRLGGEEFAFLLPAAGAEAGARHAELCRARLATIDSAPTGHDFRITASFGVVDSTRAGYDFHQLLARVDEALYRAKHAGRDRVEQYAEAT